MSISERANAHAPKKPMQTKVRDCFSAVVSCVDNGSLLRVSVTLFSVCNGERELKLA